MPPATSSTAPAMAPWPSPPRRWPGSSANSPRSAPACSRGWGCRPPRPESAGRRRSAGVELLRQVILLADPLDQRQLGLQPVDVLLLGVEDVGEQLAADVVVDRLAM